MTQRTIREHGMKKALEKAKAILGDSAAVEYRKTALKKSERAAISAQCKKLRLEKPDGWKKQYDYLFPKAITVRCYIGKITMGFFCVEGSGDTWEEAFANIKRRSMV